MKKDETRQDLVDNDCHVASQCGPGGRQATCGAAIATTKLVGTAADDRSGPQNS